MNNKLDISVVVPLYNEAESLPELVAWIDRVAVSHGYAYEVILVDDGSSDGSWEVVESLREKYPAIRGIGFARNYGKSAALYCGFAAAEGEVVSGRASARASTRAAAPKQARAALQRARTLPARATRLCANSGRERRAPSTQGRRRYGVVPGKVFWRRVGRYGIGAPSSGFLWCRG